MIARWTRTAEFRKNRSLRRGIASLGLLAAIAVAARSPAADWPTYRHDAARSGITGESLKPPLEARWVFQPHHAPDPAWGEPNPRPVGGWHGLTELRRVHFDDAFHTAVADGAVYFGSSSDGKVYSLDARTGQLRWSFRTGGPVRLAPMVAGDKVYVGSDDGFVYCLRASDGEEVWRFDGAPGSRKVLGSGKMISLWPVRTGVLVEDGVAYFGAGIFPAEGVYLYAVDAERGELIWCNDSCGAAPQSRISPQGYLLASENRLFAPLGRVSPAAFDRADGHLLYQSYIEHIIGGTQATLAGGQLFTGTEQMIGFDQSSYRSRSSWFWGHELVVAPEVFYVATGRELFAAERESYGEASLRRKGMLDRRRDLSSQIRRAASGPEDQRERLEDDMEELKSQLGETEAKMASGERWRVPCDCAESLVLAGDVVFAGGEGKVAGFDVRTGKTLWSAELDGKARGLAVAGGRLLVSSDSGAIYCFGPEGSEGHGVVEQPVEASPFPADEMTPVFEAAAEHIVDTTKIRRGYCLVLGCGTGRLAFELASRTDLQICAVEPDRNKAEAARQALDAAGLYGARVLVERSDLSQVPFSDYFANLVVSETALTSGEMPDGAGEALRMLKPLGGTICIGQPAAAEGKVKPLRKAAMQRWLEDAGVEGAEVSENDGRWLTFERGALPGAGRWTHQYAEPGNTTCSDDQLVRCPLGVLWFGGPGPGQMAERHRRAAAPLATAGRIFVLGEGSANRIGAGENSVMAYDAYNGIKLWERKIHGALRVSVTHDAGNSAATDDSLFIAIDDKCLRLDAATGETKHTYTVPRAENGETRQWGYVAVVDDVLYGSRTAQARIADCVFALDVKSGEPLWKYEAEGIAQGAIAIGDGRMFFAASNVTEKERQQALTAQMKALHRMSDAEREAFEKDLEAATVHRAVALDAATGEKQWERPVEITGAVGGAYWCSLGAIYKDDVLVLFGVFLDGHYWRQFFAGQFESRRVIALSGSDGEPLWKKHIGYRVRPIVVGDALHAEPWAYDLHTGEQKTRIHPITGKEEAWQFARPGHHCGCPAASPHTLLFRSYTLGWYDLEGDYGTEHFGAQRPGCWINFIPANGLLMVPEASSGCMCPFPNVCTTVFKSKDEKRQWAYFSQPGETTPVKRLALNLGAPGDRKDETSRLWLGYPRPGGSLVFQLEADLSFYPGHDEFVHDPARLDIEGTDTPWLFCSGMLGLKQCKLPLAGPADGTARYTVRLAFAEPEHEAAGKRVFDIKLQDEVVAEGFDIYGEAGARNRAVVKEFRGIEADEQLAVEFVSRSAASAPAELPIVQAIEIEREKVLTLGCTAPRFLLCDAEPRQTAEFVVANLKQQDFSGALHLDLPDGFALTPRETSIEIPSGDRKTVSVSVAVAEKGPAESFPVGVKLVAADGTVECEKQTTLEYLGNLQRTVLQPVEDTHVHHSSPTANHGTSGHLNVDGGDREMGDHHHGLAYLKFRVEVGGKPVSAVLRLHNAGNPTGDSGQVRLVEGPWSEKEVSYETRPELGRVLAKIGPVRENQIVELPLDLALEDGRELSLAIEPTSCDGVNYVSREGGRPAELVVEYTRAP